MADTPVLLDAMNAELHRAFTSLSKSAVAGDDKQPPPYFISYSVHDTSMLTISAQYGALTTSSGSEERMADVQVRVGSPKLDNTHGEHRGSAVNSMA
ncbi:MAG: peptidase U62, partial [Terracidiphilus sp.]